MDNALSLSRHKHAALTRGEAADPGHVGGGLTDCLLALHERLLGCDHQNLLLRRFLDWAEDAGLAGGLAVHLDGESQKRELGRVLPYRSIYQLKLEGQYLGEITLMRRSRYEDNHLVIIERGLGALAKALRLARERQRLAELATRDALTGLLNRKALDDGLTTEFSRARRLGAPLTLLLIDVDDFKALNDGSGHLAGDRALRSIADVLRASTRETDLLFRQGGDEFAILLPGANHDGARECAARIRETLARRLPEPAGAAGGEHLALPGISIGAAEHEPGESPDTLLERADRSLYRAKAGRRRQSPRGIQERRRE